MKIPLTKSPFLLRRRDLIIGAGASALLPQSVEAFSSTMQQVLFSGIPSWIIAKFGPLAPYVTFAAFDDAGLYWAPNYGNLPESACFSNTRTGTRWYANAAGVLVSAPSNTTLVMPDGTGAILFESRTNLCTYSQDGTKWNAAQGGVALAPTITANYAAAPDGTLTATRGQFSLNGGSTSSDFCNVATPVGVAYTAATYAETVYVRSTDGASTYNVLLVSPDNNQSAALTVTGSWQRITFLRTSISSSSGQLQIRLRGATASSSTADILIWGFQWELGAFPGPYIPTTTASATVGADIRQLIGPALAAALAAKGAYFETNALPSTVPANRMLIGFDSGGASPSIFSTSNTQAVLRSGSSNLITAALGSGAFTGIAKVAAGLGSTTALIANAGTRGTSASAWVLGTTPYYGNLSSGTNALNGLARKLAFFSVDPTTTAGLTSP